MPMLATLFIASSQLAAISASPTALAATPSASEGTVIQTLKVGGEGG